jgi:2-polyprenyl-6-methoxyphenol hydroxylase-like FAD-dependent oxidoreductase
MAGLGVALIPSGPPGGAGPGPQSRDVVVVGGGPGGAMAAYLLARGGLRVTLLESRADFNRRFRGDTLSPSVLDYLDSLGLAEDMLAAIPHATADSFRWHAGERVYTLADYRYASRRFPYFALIPQAKFLPWLVERASAYPGFDARMSARVSALTRDDTGRVTGVRLSDARDREVLSGRVVVGADGRNSKLRALAGATITELGAALDIVWFAVPRKPTDPPLSGLQLFSGPGTLLAMLNQDTEWQLGYTIPAGGFGTLRENGSGPVVEAFSRQLPWLTDRVRVLTDTTQLTLLPVRITTVDSWYRPGILLIGDAAHVISPVGGNGINYAIADAAETANRLLPVLGNGADGGTAAVDAACQAVEAVRRPPVQRDQHRQVRIEMASRLRLQSGSGRVPLAFRIINGVPGLARWSGRRSASAVRIPAPCAELLATASPSL